MSAEPLEAVAELAESETHEVFLSCSSIDRDLAQQVKTAVEKLGLRCWMFLNDQAAGSYSAHITQAIRDCRVLVLLLTKSSNVSANVEQEIVLANKSKRTIVPLCLDPDLELSDALALQLTNLHRAQSVAELERLLQPFRARERTITPTPLADLVAPDQKVDDDDTGRGGFRWWAVLAVAVSLLGFLVVMSQVFCTRGAGEPAPTHQPS